MIFKTSFTIILIGLPKGTQLTHRNLMSNILQIHEVLPPTGTDSVYLCVLPYFHIYGMQ
eukprot:gene225-11640_t